MKTKQNGFTTNSSDIEGIRRDFSNDFFKIREVFLENNVTLTHINKYYFNFSSKYFQQTVNNIP